MKQLLEEWNSIIKWCDDHYLFFVFSFMVSLLIGMTLWLLWLEYFLNVIR